MLPVCSVALVWLLISLPFSFYCLGRGHMSLIGNRSFRQRVSSPTTSSPTYEVDSPTSDVSSPTLISQFANA